MWGYGMMGYGMMGAMFLWWVILLGGVILVGYGAVQMLRNKKGSGNQALEQLKMRLAMGEISQDEYLERKHLLQG
jgi:putative membrane protein